MPDCQKFTCCGEESYTYEVGGATPNPSPVDTYLVRLFINGDGEVSGAGTWAAGTYIQITATPADGQQFSGWTGDYEGTENPATIFIDGDKGITAVFIPQVFYVSLSANPEGSATLTGQGPYGWGDTAVIEATPLNYFEFQNFSGDISTIDNPEEILVFENVSIVANLTRTQFELSLSASPTGAGTATGSGNYSNGQTAVISANPAPGFCFKRWTGDVNSELNPENVFMDANKTAVANYAPDACCTPYVLVLVLDQTGSIGAGGAAAGISIIDTTNISAMGVVSFGDSVCNIYPITTDTAAVRAYLQDAIDNPLTSPFFCDTGGDTPENGVDALSAATDLLSVYSSVNPKAIYFKTDTISYAHNTTDPVTVNAFLNSETMTLTFLEFGSDGEGEGDGTYPASFPETAKVTWQGFPDCSSY